MKLLGRIIASLFHGVVALIMQPDKTAHFYWGASMGLCALWIDWWSLMAVAIAATLKEGYDFLNPPHQCEFADFLATMFGGGIAICLIMYRLHYA